MRALERVAVLEARTVCTKEVLMCHEKAVTRTMQYLGEVGRSAQLSTPHLLSPSMENRKPMIGTRSADGRHELPRTIRAS